jgi:hypothetical protein
MFKKLQVTLSEKGDTQESAFVAKSPTGLAPSIRGPLLTNSAQGPTLETATSGARVVAILLSPANRFQEIEQAFKKIDPVSKREEARRTANPLSFASRSQIAERR